MFDFLFLPQNFPFAVALAVMLGIAAMEGVGTLFGMGMSAILESALPEFDIDVDLAGETEFDAAPGPFTSLLTWLRFGKVPALVVLVLFLTAFGLIGLAVQGAAARLLGSPLMTPLAVVPAFVGALPIVRVGAGWLSRMMPKEETAAVSRETFVGRIATIVLGTSRRGEPAEARLRDALGRTHYVMVEPDEQDKEFPAGSAVLLVRSDGARFRGIAPPSDALLDHEFNK